jgi:nucleoside-diphosphate-sugar epimerase
MQNTKFNKSLNILVTGGAGFIGSKLCTKLVNLGAKVTCIDIMKYSEDSLNHLMINKNFIFLKKDVKDLILLKKLIKKNNIIIPLAGLVGAPLCEKYPLEAKKINYDHILNIIKFCSKKNKIIYLTTNSGYGIGEKSKFCDENTPLNPISIYGKTKVQAEQKVLEFKNSISFRLATVFGYSYRMRSDLLVNNFVNTALKEKKLVLFESNFRRNFIHIDDVVSAIIFSIKNFKKLKGTVYNLGLSEANIDKGDLAKKIKKYIKIRIIKKNNQKDPDKRDYFVSNLKIEKKGFKAKVSLDDGIKELIKIFQISKKIVKNNY